MSTYAQPRWSWLPLPDTWKYHALLFCVAVFVLGPLGGVTASYMNFSLGFFIGGQVLAGILGSTVTYGYGAEGKHGANYIQTAAASVASLSAMGIVIQAMVWMGLPQPPMWQLIVFFLCIGLFAAGVGMLYTPVLVDRMQLTFPSGLAVANILRALTDPDLLRRSVAKLGAGMGIGIVGGIAATKVAFLEKIEFSASGFGAGMVIGPRVGGQILVGAFVAWALTPWFVSIGWLNAGEPFRKITFLIALGTILGAAIVDLTQIFAEAARRWRASAPAPREDQPDWKQIDTHKLLAWIALWGVGIVVCGHAVLGQPVGFLALAVFLVFVFTMVNGISLGLTDSNPISSAFVVTVLIMATLGLKDPVVGLMAGSIVLLATSTAADMQQDRSTGWRLGTSRRMQFRYQAAGIFMGAIMAVIFAKLFMAAYPVLLQDQTVLKASEQPANWSSAMTYKVVGVLRSLTEPKPYQITAIWLGVGIGFVVQLARKWVFSRRAYKRWAVSSAGGKVGDYLVDVVLLPSPYAASFGGFVNLPTSLWYGSGGLAAGLLDTFFKPKSTGARVAEDEALPSDMSTTSLFGGGLIAGDALAALGIGITGLVLTLSSR